MCVCVCVYPYLLSGDPAWSMCVSQCSASANALNLTGKCIDVCSTGNTPFSLKLLILFYCFSVGGSRNLLALPQWEASLGKCAYNPMETNCYDTWASLCASQTCKLRALCFGAPYIVKHLSTQILQLPWYPNVKMRHKWLSDKSNIC